MGNKREPFEPNTIYHVYNHGNAEDNIFRQDTNYTFFLKRYQKYIPPIADTYAYCLMPNHFHFMVRIRSVKEIKSKNPQGSRNPEGLSSLKDKFSNFISHQFGTLLNSYTKSFNKLYDRKGSLFLNTTRRICVKEDSYYTQLIRYIHLNPVKHGFAGRVGEWPYTSYQSFLSEKETSLKCKEVLEWFNGRENFIKVHEQNP